MILKSKGIQDSLPICPLPQTTNDSSVNVVVKRFYTKKDQRVNCPSFLPSPSLRQGLATQPWLILSL